MITLQSDVKKVKELLKENKNSEIIKMANIFIPEYNAKILSNLNQFERNQFLSIFYQ